MLPLSKKSQLFDVFLSENFLYAESYDSNYAYMFIIGM